MPREGYQTITVSERVYNLIKDHVRKVNEKEGYRRWRSISQFVEAVVMEYIKKEKI